MLIFLVLHPFITGLQLITISGSTAISDSIGYYKIGLTAGVITLGDAVQQENDLLSGELISGGCLPLRLYEIIDSYSVTDD